MSYQRHHSRRLQGGAVSGATDAVVSSDQAAREPLRPERARRVVTVAFVGLLIALLVANLIGQAAPLPARSAEVAGRLLSLCVARPPTGDDARDSVWGSASLLQIPLHRGRDSRESAFSLDLRSVHTAERVYFQASWPEQRPEASSQEEAQTVRNKLILHYELAEPWQGASDLMCLVSCHTAFVDDTGRVLFVAAETIPPGQTDPLPACGGWDAGRWWVQWSRPLVSANPFDLQFQDLSGEHPFFVKIIEGLEGRADPVSKTYLLVLEP